LQISLLLGLHLDNCLHEVLVPDNITIASQRQHARLNADGLALGACVSPKIISDKKKILTVEIVAATRQLVKINVRMDVHLARVNLHNASACLLVWGGEFDFTIETTGTEQGRIQNVNAIRSSNDFDVVVGLKRLAKVLF
jgi:hypothetical protein